MANYEGACEFISHESDKIVSSNSRLLHEDGCDVLIRYNELNCKNPLLKKAILY